MRGVREQPRVAAAWAIGAMLLVAAGIGVGLMLAGGPDQATFDRTEAQPRQTRAELERTQERNRRQAERLTETGEQSDQLRRASNAAARRSERPGRANARLRRQLRQARSSQD
jgi:uncharacterized protein HemX